MIPNPSFKMSHTSVTFYKRYQTSDQQKNSKKVLRIGPILITFLHLIVNITLYLPHCTVSLVLIILIINYLVKILRVSS